MVDIYGGIARAVESNIFNGRVSNDSVGDLKQRVAQGSPKTQEEEYIYTPSRWDPSGWKYVKKNTIAEKHNRTPFRKNFYGYSSQPATVSGNLESSRDGSSGTVDHLSVGELNSHARTFRDESSVDLSDFRHAEGHVNKRIDDIKRSVSVDRRKHNDLYVSTYLRSYDGHSEHGSKAASPSYKEIRQRQINQSMMLPPVPFSTKNAYIQKISKNNALRHSLVAVQ